MKNTKKVYEILAKVTQNGYNALQLGNFHTNWHLGCVIFAQIHLLFKGSFKWEERVNQLCKMLFYG